MTAKPATLTDSRAGDERAQRAADPAGGGDREAREPGGREARELADDRYRVERELARGGRGRVWLAHDRAMQRTIAIKQPAQRGAVSDARFLREGLITARLQHPAIVPVYDAGRWDDGAPYYTMKLVEGQTLRDRIAAATTRAARLALLPHVVAVADAVAYAHERGVIHRDLKPANVVCGAFGETVVVDWGLAKVPGDEAAGTADEAADEAAGTADEAAGTADEAAGTADEAAGTADEAAGTWSGPADETGGPADEAAGPADETAGTWSGSVERTATGAVIGTPAYMPPEQARGEPAGVSADIYAIGAILYHMLSAAPPFDGASGAEVIERVLAGPPRPLSRADAPVDLAAVVERAMARAPDQRYAAASELADDLRRFIAGRLVSAHEYSRAARLARWAARHRAVVALAAAALVAIAVIAGVAVERVIAERDAARAARELADARADAVVLAHAREVLDRDPAAALAWLKTYRGDGQLGERGTGAPAAAVRGVRALAIDAESRGPARHVWRHGAGVGAIAVSQTGRLVATGSSDLTVGVWDAVTGRAVDRLAVEGAITGLAFTADERALVAIDLGGAVHVRELAADARAAEDPRRGSPALSQLGDNAHRAASALPPVGDGARAVVPGAKRSPAPALRPVTDDTRALVPGTTRSHALGVGPLFALAIAADDRTIVVGGAGGAPIVVDRFRGEPRALIGTGPRIAALVLDGHDGVVTGDAEGALQRWPLDGHGPPRLLARHEGAVNDLAILDGAVLSAGEDAWLRRNALAGRDGHASDAPTPPTASTGPRGLRLAGIGVDLALARDGTVAIAARDGRAYVVRGTEIRALAAPGAVAELYEVAWSPDGTRLAAGLADGRVVAWDLASGAARELAHHRPGPVHLAFGSDGALLAAGNDGVARLWPAHRRDGTVVVRPHRVMYLAASETGAAVLADDHGELALAGPTGVRTLHQGDPASAVAISADGTEVWAATWDRAVRHWRAGELTVLDAGRGMTWAVARHGDRFATAGAAGVQLWRGGERRTLALDGDARSVAFAPDGTYVLVAASDGTVRLWRTDGSASRTLAMEQGEVYLVAISRDGRRAVSVTLAGIRLWKTSDWTSRALATPAHVRWIAFSPDGAYLAATTAGAAIPLWDVETGERRDLPGPARGSNKLAFAPAAGARFATTGVDGAVRVWDVASGLERIAHRFDAEAYDLAWTATGIIASSADRTVWSGSGDGRIAGHDVQHVLERTTAVIVDGAATSDPPTAAP